MGCSWMKKEGPEGDIVLGTRVRLARNFAKLPFPATANRDQAKQVLQKGELIAEKLGELTDVKFYRLAEVDKLEREVMMEKHLISPAHTENTASKGLILSLNEDISIMINEEDHLRIQVLFPGLQLRETWGLANKVDDLVESVVDYAFSPNIGYLTACPTNVGTGMRGSVMLHLPGLARIQQLSKVLTSISQFGLVVRGLYGEGSKSFGNIYQISNQVSLGYSETDVLEHLAKVTAQIISSERQARQYLIEKQQRIYSEDQIFRAYGLLTNARTMTTQEALELLSSVRLGIDLDLIKDLNKNLLKELMVEIRAAHLQKIMGQSLPHEERDRLRASLIRDRLRQNTADDS